MIAGMGKGKRARRAKHKRRQRQINAAGVALSSTPTTRRARRGPRLNSAPSPSSTPTAAIRSLGPQPGAITDQPARERHRRHRGPTSMSSVLVGPSAWTALGLAQPPRTSTSRPPERVRTILDRPAGSRCPSCARGHGRPPAIELRSRQPATDPTQPRARARHQHRRMRMARARRAPDRCWAVCRLDRDDLNLRAGLYYSAETDAASATAATSSSPASRSSAATAQTCLAPITILARRARRLPTRAQPTHPPGPRRRDASSATPPNTTRTTRRTPATTLDGPRPTATRASRQRSMASTPTASGSRPPHPTPHGSTAQTAGRPAGLWHRPGGTILSVGGRTAAPLALTTAAAARQRIAPGTRAPPYKADHVAGTGATAVGLPA